MELRQQADAGASVFEMFDKIHDWLELPSEEGHQATIISYMGLAFIKGADDAMLLKRLTTNIARENGHYVNLRPKLAEEMLEAILENRVFWGKQMPTENPNP